MRKPLVGVTCLVEPVRFGAWTTNAALVPISYVRALEHAGARPLAVPPSVDAIDETLDAIDGLVLSGGVDIDPAVYGARPGKHTNGVQPARDRAEIELVNAALARDMPTLAVCRGSQVLNVARGGDLVQHLPDVVGHERHRHTPGVFADHDVELETGTRLEAILGERAPVKSHHHQGYGRIGHGLRVAAWADDGTPEALEDPDQRFAVGVLWHPEEGEDFSLFRTLVDEARRYGAARSRTSNELAAARESGD